MSKINDKMTVNTAEAAPFHEHDAIYSDHQTSQCFMRPAPILCVETVPKRKTVIKCESFARFQPMPRAVFGRANICNRAFFVPFRTVFRHFNSFVVNSPTPVSLASTQVLSKVPTITNRQLLDLILYNVENNSGYFVREVALGVQEDFTVGGSFRLQGSYRFTDQGIYLYKVLRSLGYPIVFHSDFVKENSLLPLLAFIKVHLDWYYPSAFAYSSVFAYFEQFFDNATPSSVIETGQLANFFTQIAYCAYNQDYFTSSWTNPVGPNSASFEGALNVYDIANVYPINDEVAVDEVSSQGVNNTSNSNGTPSINSSSQGADDNPRNFRLNQFMIDALRSMTDYTVRHRLSGVRALDRTLAEWGVNLGSEIAKRSIYLGYDEFPCQFGDNMSTADTDGARLGDYSGRGIGYDRGTFTFDGSPERGLLLVVNSVVPQTGYYQGYDRHVDHIRCLDFYHGDYDHLGVQALGQLEVFNYTHEVNMIGADTPINGVFGFVPRYAEYLCHNDHLTGLPSLKSLRTQYEGMTLQRDLWPIYTLLVDSPIQLSFQQRLEFVLAYDYDQYNRLFYSTDQVDNIDFIHHFTIIHTDTLKDLFEVYDFEKKLNSVRMHVNGTSVQ